MEHLEELRKLMRLQGAGPERALAGLVRVAAAGGASQVFLRTDPVQRELEVRFDGRPFTARELGSVFDSLFSRAGSPRPRSKELAAALLGLLRADPERVTVSSGLGEGRSVLRLDSLESAAVESARGPGGETVVLARERPFASEPLFGAGTGPVLSERCALSRIPVYLDGRLLPPFDPELEGREGAAFDSGGVRGWVGIPADPRLPSRLAVSQLGVRAAEAEVSLPEVQVEGRVNDDRLRLDAAKGDCLRDEAWTRMLARVAAAAGELVEEAARLQSARSEVVAEALRDPAALEWWRRRLSGEGVAGRPDLEADARRTLWLRGAASAFPAARGAPLFLEDGPREADKAAPPGVSGSRRREPRAGAEPLPQDADAGDVVAGLSVWFRRIGVPAELRAAQRVLDGLVGPAADLADGVYELNLRHPLLAGLLSRGRGAGILPFAASVVLTGLNRLQPELTDREDAGLQAEIARGALADGLGGGRGGDGESE